MTFQTALTGLNAASTQLEAISNNIANNATSGFKRSRVEFADVFATSSFGGGSPSVGAGVQVANVRQEFAQGDMQFTNRNLDLAVEGLGMFRLNDNGSSVYTRSGTFGMDREGFITDTAGNKLTGFGVSELGAIQPITTDLQVDFTDLPPKPTTSISVAANLDINDGILPPFDVSDPGTFNFSTSTTVFDSLGAGEVANVYFRRDAPNAWSAFTYIAGQSVSADPLVGDQVNFSADGSIQDVNGDPAGIFQTSTFNPASGGEPMQIDIDISEISQFDNSFGVNKISQDGSSAGRLEDFDIDPSGIIFGRFSNGQANMMGQITLTNFPNIEGLRQIGANSWTETFSSGEPATGEPNSASLGGLLAGALEGSNVDITEELVSMISSQQSFQANAQVISTGDTLTQTVINIRR